MKSYKKFSLIFILVPIVLLLNSITTDDYLFKIILYWFSCSFFYLGGIYFLNKPNLLAKNQYLGRISGFIILFNLPYFLLINSIWFLKDTFSKENRTDYFFENYYIGKKVSFKNLPKNIETVVDLTAELNEDYDIVRNKNYILFPILDGSIPDINDFYLLIKKITNLQNNIYIHCAEGHGRTAIVAIVLYLLKNKELSINDGISFVKSKREKISLNETQKEFLNSFIDSEYFLDL
ncbi:MAG: dual specificity protein phosphatase family protein [Leptospiraceae bacterium]|nr:dual specificity protein phosphatase family protein [Leptospiraceae bacterium]